MPLPVAVGAPPGTAAAGVVIGVDLGGTKTSAAAVTAEGAVGPVRTVPTPALAGPGAVLDAVADLVRAVAAEAEQDGAAQGGVRAIGVGTAGVVDVGAGAVISATDSFTGWAGTAVRDGLRTRLADRGALPVSVENDVDAHAAGEAWLGAAAGAGSALVVTVGTGVGGSVVLGGEPIRGAHHVAGEIGHLPTPGAEGLRCSCGRPGHLEAIGSGPALHRYYLALGGDPAASDARDVVVRAGSGSDPLAARAVRDSATAVGRALAGVVTVLDPAVVVVGGGLAGAGPLWWDAVEATLRAELIDVLADVPVVPAQLGASAAIVGAARGAWRLVEVPR